MQKIIIPILGNEVAPRFDLATEIQIATFSKGELQESRTIVLPAPSAEKLCHLVITENARVLVCGGIEDEYHQYLTWKRIQVIDAVIGHWRTALDWFIDGKLAHGDIVDDKKEGEEE